MWFLCAFDLFSLIWSISFRTKCVVWEYISALISWNMIVWPLERASVTYLHFIGGMCRATEGFSSQKCAQPWLIKTHAHIPWSEPPEMHLFCCVPWARETKTVTLLHSLSDTVYDVGLGRVVEWIWACMTGGLWKLVVGQPFMFYIWRTNLF